MRHHNANRKFNRKQGQRKALIRSLAVALIQKEKIQTTEAKAKEIRPVVEKMVTNAKKATLAAHRDLIAQVGAVCAKKLITNLGPRYKDRKGGYLRVVKAGIRVKDASSQAFVEFV